MHRKTTIFLIIGMILLMAVTALADVSVTIQLDRMETSTADPVTMTVSVSGVRSLEKSPQITGLEQFSVSQGGTASRMEIVNGRTSSSVEFTYFLQPKRTGVFEIGPAEVNLKGSTYRSNIVPLKIVEQEHVSDSDRGSLFLTASLSKNRIYVEEQVLYILKLYIREKVSDISLEIPESDVLTFKQLGKPAEYQGEYNGRSYRILEVRYSLSAAREGDYRISPARMKMTVVQQGRGPRVLFDDPFFPFAQGRPATVSGDQVDLTVRPLPKEGSPADFTGLVGQFEVESELEPSEIKAGESATLTITLKGRGNVSRLPDLKAPDLPGTKIYEDQPVLESTEDADGIAGVKTLKWAIVPEKQGVYTLPPISMSFFDPKVERYSTSRSEPPALHVSPGNEKPVAAVASNGPRGQAGVGIKEIGRDILPVHTSLRAFSSGGSNAIGGMPLLIILVGPMLVYAGVFIGLRWNRRSGSSAAGTRARNAAKVFLGICRNGNPGSEALLEALRNYLNDRLALSLGALTPLDAYETLRSVGIGEDAAARLRGMVQQLEDSVYTGRAGDPCPFAGDFGELITRIEKDFK